VYKMGLIGAGAVVRGAHVPLLKERQDLDVVAVADPVEENRKAVGEVLGCGALFDDYRRVLDHPEIQAVDICLPHFMHEEAVLAAFDAGKDVILEKPIAITLCEADRMIAAALDKGRRFYVSLNQRFCPAHRKVKAILDSGEYGRPFLVLTHVIGDEFARMNDAASWKGSWDRAGGGALGDTGTHVIDLMLWWFGRPQTVSCQWGRFLVEPETKADDNVCVTLGYPGMLAEVVVCYSALSDPWTEDKHIYFRDDSLHVKIDIEQPLSHGRSKEAPEVIELEPVLPNWWTHSVSRSLNHFIDCLQGRAEPAYGPEAARETLEIILMAYRAAEERKTLLVGGC